MNASLSRQLSLDTAEQCRDHPQQDGIGLLLAARPPAELADRSIRDAQVHRLDAGATTYGLLWSTMGIGALIGLLVAPALTRMSRPGATMAGLVVLNGLAMLPDVACSTGGRGSRGGTETCVRAAGVDRGAGASRAAGIGTVTGSEAASTLTS